MLITMPEEGRLNFGQLGAPRTLASILAAACAAVFVLIWVAWACHWALLEVIDRPLLDALHAYGAPRPRWVTGWQIFCDVLSPTTFRVIGLLVVIVAAMRGRYRVAIFVALSVGLSGPLSALVKVLTDRPRPSSALVSAPSSSLPSGHAVGVTVGVLTLLVVFVPVLGVRARAAAVVGGAATIATVGIARVVLNVHHPSDVVAGWAFGYAYVVLCLTAVRTARPPRSLLRLANRRHDRPNGSVAPRAPRQGG